MESRVVAAAPRAKAPRNGASAAKSPLLQADMTSFLYVNHMMMCTSLQTQQTDLFNAVLQCDLEYEHL
eukprot:4114095-Pleurochrysis_carterae.AAC.2